METNHHYVPIWYQNRFKNKTQQKYYYLDLSEDRYKYKSKDNQYPGLKYYPVKYCFKEKGLYSKRWFTFSTDDIEQKYFGKIDSQGSKVIDRW